MSYYSEDGITFSNRLLAGKYRHETNKKIYYYYNDDFYSKLNWLVEPEGELEFHYKNQAQRIRDEYDYVILMYSGGFDSSNILETYYYNNIRLDKIVCMGALKQDEHSDTDENHNGELYRNAFPNLSSLGLDSIVQVFDFSQYYSDITQLSLYQYGEDWIERIGGRYSPCCMVFHDIHKYIVPEQYQNKKVAIVWGVDKPSIYTENGKNGFRFSDMRLTSYGRFNNPRSPNIENVNFYWDINYPLILLKQLHLLKKAIPTPITNEQVGRFVYKLKNPLVYKSPKSRSSEMAIRDSFVLDHKDSDIYKFHQLGMKKAKETYHGQLSPIMSKFYAIE